jgi:hypothetical protein
MRREFGMDEKKNCQNRERGNESQIWKRRKEGIIGGARTSSWSTISKFQNSKDDKDDFSLGHSGL